MSPHLQDTGWLGRPRWSGESDREGTAAPTLSSGGDASWSCSEVLPGLDSRTWNSWEPRNQVGFCRAGEDGHPHGLNPRRPRAHGWPGPPASETDPGACFPLTSLIWVPRREAPSSKKFQHPPGPEFTRVGPFIGRRGGSASPRTPWNRSWKGGLV